MPPVLSGCRRCGEAVKRVRRRPFDHVVGLLVELRRVRCDDTRCGWTGAMIRQFHVDRIFVLLVAAAVLAMACLL